ncbi:hypothetical protein GALMADRAFT_1107559 [Galerina marginata CBS 339.88]|uniref:Uncharacterized protein n=1 Tax=Galerina marginata (strain CBS 339.88) TaxID=685588 RepID=A0A067TLK2_GALM3|nr:hypothetical protein GALMADRAFT_1107559 [Galerina marginata CBS 339.88]
MIPFNMSFFFASFSSGSHFASGSHSGSSGIQSASYSASAPRAQAAQRELTIGETILTTCFYVMLFNACAVIVLLVGNEVLRASHHNHLEARHMALAGTIGELILVVFVIGCILVYDLLLSFDIDVTAPRTIIWIIYPTLGAPLCGVLGVAVLLSRQSFKRMDLLYATEAGFIGAAVIVGGWHALCFCLALIFNPYRLIRELGVLFQTSQYGFRITRRKKQPTAEVTTPPPYEP